MIFLPALLNATNLLRDVHGDIVHKRRDGKGSAGSAQWGVAWMYSKTQELISGENSLSPSASGDGGRIP